MRVGRRGDGNERAGAKEVPRRGDVVAALVPEVGQAEQCEVREVDGGEEDGVEHPQRQCGARAGRGNSIGRVCGHELVDGTAGRSELWLEREGAEGLFVLGEVVAEDVEQGLGLLRADVDALEVLDLHFVSGVLAHGSEDEEEVPNTHADLDAVGVAVAVVFGVSRRDGGRIGGLLRLGHIFLNYGGTGWETVRTERSAGFE
jgi:hypothetical protein